MSTTKMASIKKVLSVRGCITSKKKSKTLKMIKVGVARLLQHPLVPFFFFEMTGLLASISLNKIKSRCWDSFATPDFKYLKFGGNYTRKHKLLTWVLSKK